MKLATALSERSELQRRIDELGVRLNNNAKVQEGEEPSESPADLLEELDRCMKRLEFLATSINLTNSRTVFKDSKSELNGMSMTALLSKRDCLKQKIYLMRNFLDTASSKANRMSRTEIKIVSTVPVAELQKSVDAMAKELRETDEKIQELNWTTDLME